MNLPSKFHRLWISNALVRSITFPLFMVHLVSVTVLVTDAKFLFHLFQIESHAVLCEASCQHMCVEQGIMYVSLVTNVGPSETDNKKLIDMLRTTRIDMHQSAHNLNELKQFFMHYIIIILMMVIRFIGISIDAALLVFIISTFPVMVNT